MTRRATAPRRPATTPVAPSRTTPRPRTPMPPASRTPWAATTANGPGGAREHPRRTRTTRAGNTTGNIKRRHHGQPDHDLDRPGAKLATDTTGAGHEQLRVRRGRKPPGTTGSRPGQTLTIGDEELVLNTKTNTASATPVLLDRRPSSSRARTGGAKPAVPGAGPAGHGPVGDRRGQRARSPGGSNLPFGQARGPVPATWAGGDKGYVGRARADAGDRPGETSAPARYDAVAGPLPVPRPEVRVERPEPDGRLRLRGQQPGHWQRPHRPELVSPTRFFRRGGCPHHSEQLVHGSRGDDLRSRRRSCALSYRGAQPLAARLHRRVRRPVGMIDVGEKISTTTTGARPPSTVLAWHRTCSTSVFFSVPPSKKRRQRRTSKSSPTASNPRRTQTRGVWSFGQGRRGISGSTDKQQRI